MGRKRSVAPIVKWAGGKRGLLRELVQYIPDSMATYYEPFLGGGALFFYLQPQQAVVGDINEELINIYRVIKEDVEALITDLQRHRNCAKYFYRLRALDRDEAGYRKLSAVTRASRLLYLNKTCYNGLYRVNKAGQFNTPFGHYPKANIVNERGLQAVSHFLQTAQVRLLCADFATVLAGTGENDFVYLDPPYDPLSPTASFTAYHAGGFDHAQQLRLKQVCDDLTRRGTRFLLSNSATDFIKDLYRDYCCTRIEAKRVINSNVEKRGAVEEVLITNYLPSPKGR